MSKFNEKEVAAIVEKYVEVADKDYSVRSAAVAAIAKDTGVSVPSIRGVLVSEGVYVPKPKAEKSESSMDKDALVAAFETVTCEKLPSMSKMTKKDLEKLWGWIVLTSDRREADAK